MASGVCGTFDLLLTILNGTGKPYDDFGFTLGSLAGRFIMIVACVSFWVVIQLAANATGFGRQMKYAHAPYSMLAHTAYMRLPAYRHSNMLVTACTIMLIGNCLYTYTCFFPERNPPPKKLFMATFAILPIFTAFPLLFLSFVQGIPDGLDLLL